MRRNNANRMTQNEMTNIMTKYFTPNDIANELKMSQKNVRRMLRARNIRVGRGQRHVFDNATFKRHVKTLRDARDAHKSKNDE